LSIHPTAIVESGATLGDNCEVGPFCFIGNEVDLGRNSICMSHVVITGPTKIGEGARIHPHAVIGGDPQNTAHKGGRTTLTVGRNCLIREGVTMNRGTDQSRGATIVGDDCIFLAYAHVAHDCALGNKVTFANNVMIGGHCDIGDGVIIGGGGAVHQFCRVGNNAFIGGVSAVTRDLIPYGMAVGVYADLGGLNLVGLKRAGTPRQEIHALRNACKMLFDRRRPMHDNIGPVRLAYPESALVQRVLDFISVDAKRSYCTPPVSANRERSDGGNG
jgi:UDP-N-acetylglucosamine acyltransferase